MKVLLIAPQPFFRIRGTPINVRNVAQALSDAGHTVDLLCYPFGETPEHLRNVRIVRGTGFPGIRDVKIGPSLAKIPLDGLLFLKAWQLCRKGDYEVIHAVEESVFFAVWLSKWFKCPLIYDMDSVISDQLAYTGKLKPGWVLNRIIQLETWAIRNARFVLTVCASLTETTRSLVPDAPVVQIEDAPVDETFAPAPNAIAALREEFALGDRPTVVYTGNLESYQGVDLLIPAAEEARKVASDILFLLVGGSADQVAAYKSQVAEAGLSEHFVLTGTRPVQEMSAFMALATILVSPRKEGTNTALKIYSYMQSGKPIVATNLATHTQVLDDQSAVLTAATGPAIGGGITTLIANTKLASDLGAAAARKVEEQYSLAQFRSRVANAYATYF